MNQTLEKKMLKSQKRISKPDPLQEERLVRLAAVETVLSPFWSVRSAYIFR